MNSDHEAYLDERFSDRVNDIIHDYEHGEFQDWVWQTLAELRDEIQTIEARVHRATGVESWQYDGDLKGLYSAIKAFYDEPKKPEIERVMDGIIGMVKDGLQNV